MENMKLDDKGFFGMFGVEKPIAREGGKEYLERIEKFRFGEYLYVMKKETEKAEEEKPVFECKATETNINQIMLSKVSFRHENNLESYVKTLAHICKGRGIDSEIEGETLERLWKERYLSCYGFFAKKSYYQIVNTTLAYVMLHHETREQRSLAWLVRNRTMLTKDEVMHELKTVTLNSALAELSELERKVLLYSLNKGLGVKKFVEEEKQSKATFYNILATAKNKLSIGISGKPMPGKIQRFEDQFSAFGDFDQDGDQLVRKAKPTKEDREKAKKVKEQEEAEKGMAKEIRRINAELRRIDKKLNHKGELISPFKRVKPFNLKNFVPFGFLLMGK